MPQEVRRNFMMLLLADLLEHLSPPRVPERQQNGKIFSEQRTMLKEKAPKCGSSFSGSGWIVSEQ
jgi:hypothetical protein